MAPPKRIVFTGGSGKAGQYAIYELLKKGYKVLNLDIVEFPDPSAGVFTLKTDLANSGQVWNALTTHYNREGYQLGRPEPPPDAVIHFGAYARNMIVPDNETFQTNVVSNYNVIEAACKLGVKKIIIASSEATYGACFSEGDVDYHSLPLEEDYDVDPMDTYGLSKVCSEQTAKTFARRYGVDIYALRIGSVIAPEQYESEFAGYVNDPASRKRHGWSYIDARDLGRMCVLGVEKSGLGFQIFNATNSFITTKTPTEQFLREAAPNTPITRKMGEREAPLSNRKIREMLGFEDEHDWKKYCNP